MAIRGIANLMVMFKNLAICLTDATSLVKFHRTCIMFLIKSQVRNFFLQFKTNGITHPHFFFSGNVLFSPLSFQLLLFTLREATRGETAKQIENALNNFDNSGTVATKNWTKNSEKLKMMISNGIFVPENVMLQRDFERWNEKFFSSVPIKVDFANAAKSAQTINGFVKNNTEGKIDKLFEPGMMGLIFVIILMKKKILFFFSPPSQTISTASQRPFLSTRSIFSELGNDRSTCAKVIAGFSSRTVPHASMMCPS